MKLTKIEKSWVLYDVGNSAFTMMVSTVIPIYFKNLASESGISASDSTAFWGYAVSLTTVIIAILGPLLGTLADSKDLKKPIFSAFMMLGVLACAALAVPVSWVIFLAVFVFAKVGFSGSLVFYDSMLTDITTDERADRVSTSGFAWGYIGSCVPFTLSLALILTAKQTGLGTATATSLAFLLTALWWGLVSIPLLKNYKQKYYIVPEGNPIKESLVRLGSTLKNIRQDKHIVVFLIAFFFYIDGVYTIIDMATSYGKDVGISDNNLLLALLLTQVVAFPFAILFGRLSQKIKTANLLKIAIAGYFLISVFALQLDQAWEFWFLAVCVAAFQGGIQALSRSYFSKIIPKEKSNEYFGFFDIFGKGAAFTGTMAMGVATQLTGSSRYGVVVIAVMFVVGFLVFMRAAKLNKV